MITTSAPEAIHPIHDRCPLVLPYDKVEEFMLPEEPPHELVPPSKASSPSTQVKFLSVADLSQRWGCSTGTVKRMARENLISQTYFSARMSGSRSRRLSAMSASAGGEPLWGVDVRRAGCFEKAGVGSPFQNE